ncbi:hypothetical protein ACIA48_16080 [Mycobacterium sp. NPDC051804]|uniref:hypothetical protein n=1 Tax=Mycobacterium sp. NPDC051804 TaxID=3364295 RepID=UPI0037AABDD3
MDPVLGHAWIWALVVPLGLMMAFAIFGERRQRRRDRAEGVVMSFGDLRLTDTHLIVGSGPGAERIALSGLSAKVAIATAPDRPDEEVQLTIENGGHHIRRSQPYTYGASGNAQAFAIKFNMLSGHHHKVPGNVFGQPSERRAA